VHTTNRLATPPQSDLLLAARPSEASHVVVSYVTIQELATTAAASPEILAQPPLGPVIAEGRVLDAVAGCDLTGTLDELADALGVSYSDLRTAIDELAAIRWITVDVLPEGLILSLPEDARVAI
jgi:hypothetical protein